MIEVSHFVLVTNSIKQKYRCLSLVFVPPWAWVAFLPNRFLLVLFQPDALLCFLEELCRQSGELKPETQTAEACAPPLGQLGVCVADGEVPDGAGLVGSAAAHVDAINELIQSDHQYHKEEPCAPVASCVASAPSNSVGEGLLNGSEVLPALAPKGLQSRRAELALRPGQVVVVSSLAPSPAAPISAASAGWTSANSGTLSLGSSSKAAMMTIMVDPNVVCPPLPVRASPPAPEEAEVPEVAEELSGFQLDMDIESFADLLKMDVDFPLNDPQPQQHQAVITASTPVSPTVSNSKRKQSSAIINSVSPPVHVGDVSRVTYGLESEAVAEEDCRNGSDSSDSGFSGDLDDERSAPSDGSSSPGSFSDSSAEMDGVEWQEDFTELKLFPEIGFGVFSA